MLRRVTHLKSYKYLKHIAFLLTEGLKVCLSIIRIQAGMMYWKVSNTHFFLVKIWHICQSW